MQIPKDCRPDTILQHWGEETKVLGSVTPPIFQNSLFVFDEYEHFMSTMLDKPSGPPHHYSRLGNPTVEIAEKNWRHSKGPTRQSSSPVGWPL